MNTTNQTIPATFSPDTVFAITLTESKQTPEHASEKPMSFQFAWPAEEELQFRGIPESALHD